MVAALSLTCLLCGGGLACTAAHRPARAVVLERWGGTLLIAGFVLLGAGLQSAQL